MQVLNKNVYLKEIFHDITALHLCTAVLAMSEMSVRACVRPSVRPSVRLSVRLSNASIVKKRKKHMPKFLYTSFLRRMVGGGDPFYLKVWGKLALLEQKRRFSIDIRL